MEKEQGYLNQNFRLFHIKDKKNQEFEFHYHTFHKIIIFISGNVSYIIEGKAYYLKSWDILLVNNHDIHKPVIDPNSTYERIVIWLQDDFIKNTIASDCDLSSCFLTATKKQFNLIRLNLELQTKIQSIIYALEESIHANEFGSEVLNNTYFLQLMVYLNRVFLPDQISKDKTMLNYDRQVAEILKYINLNLSADLSNQNISEKFYLSKYYLMHKFKEETGYTLHHYVQQKRLMYAVDLMKQGVPIIKAAYQCGFTDYSTFHRAFKKTYKKSPRDLLY